MNGTQLAEYTESPVAVVKTSGFENAIEKLEASINFQKKFFDALKKVLKPGVHYGYHPGTATIRLKKEGGDLTLSLLGWRAEFPQESRQQDSFKLGDELCWVLTYQCRISDAYGSIKGTAERTASGDEARFLDGGRVKAGQRNNISAMAQKRAKLAALNDAIGIDAEFDSDPFWRSQLGAPEVKSKYRESAKVEPTTPAQEHTGGPVITADVFVKDLPERKKALADTGFSWDKTGEKFKQWTWYKYVAPGEEAEAAKKFLTEIGGKWHYTGDDSSGNGNGNGKKKPAPAAPKEVVTVESLNAERDEIRKMIDPARTEMWKALREKASASNFEYNEITKTFVQHF